MAYNESGINSSKGGHSTIKVNADVSNNTINASATIDSGSCAWAQYWSCKLILKIDGQEVASEPVTSMDMHSSKTIWGSKSVGNGSHTVTCEWNGASSGYAPKSGSVSVNVNVNYNPVTTYTISFNANGGSGAPNSIQKRSDQGSVTIPSTKPTRSDYVFSHWNTRSDGNGDTYYPGSTYASNANATLYAIWSTVNYAISFSGNGGYDAPSTVYKASNVSSITLPSGKPIRDGYTFKCWNTKSDGSGTNYYPGGSYSNNADVTLYAIWSVVYYTVSFNANGGTGAPNSLTKASNVYGVTIPSTKPTRSGYVFSHWNTRADGGGTSYNPGNSYTNDESVTLYAIWGVTTYTITLDANGGDKDSAFTINSNQNDVQIPSFKPSIYEWEFVSWNTKSDGKGDTYYPGGKWSLKADKILYAQYKYVGGLIRLRVNGVWKSFIPYVFKNKKWVRCDAYIYHGGWKKGAPK